jgi:hypothetical protein
VQGKPVLMAQVTAAPMTPAELLADRAASREIFDEMLDGDSNLTLQLYLNWFGFGPDSDDALRKQAIIQKSHRHDINGNGILDFDEFDRGL